MLAVIPYLASLFVIIVSVSVTVYFKSELERMFREKKEVIAFHICNVVIILMVAFAAQAVTTIYIVERDFNMLVQIGILLLMIFPVYLAGYLFYEKYKFENRKYTKAGNGKVLVINEKYLKRK